MNREFEKSIFHGGEYEVFSKENTDRYPKFLKKLKFISVSNGIYFNVARILIRHSQSESGLKSALRNREAD